MKNNRNKRGKYIKSPEELFSKTKEDCYIEALNDSSDKLGEIWNELFEIITQLTIAEELKEWETNDINVHYFVQLLKINKNTYEALLKPEERGLVFPEEILMKRKGDRYREMLVNSINKLVDIRESLFATILHLSFAGELKEWEANIEIGETFEFTKELLQNINDKNVKSLVKLLTAIENTYDTLININNIKT